MWIKLCILPLILWLSWSNISQGENLGGVLENCTVLEAEGAQACYVCMGRDQLNCDWGFTCCKGPCFKLVDDKHNIIAKGCAPSGGEDGTDEEDVTLGNAKLPWEDDEAIVGTQFFCNSGDYCNTGSSFQRGGVSLIGLVSSIGVLLFSVYVIRF